MLSDVAVKALCYMVSLYELGKLLTSYIVEPYLPYDVLPEGEIIDKALLPNILLWDPINKEKKKLHCPLCHTDNIVTYLHPTNEWETSNSSGRKPRTIWDQSWLCLLVGRIYRCQNKHQINSYHAGIIDQLNPYQVPFILSHRSGMLKTVFDSIISQIANGSNFLRIQTILRDMFLTNFMRRKMKYQNLVFPNVKEAFKLHGPSDDLIKQCLVLYHRTNKTRYKSHFHSTKAKYLSLDHTFKSAANIGCSMNGKWCVQYDSVFIGMNENGYAIGHCFTKGSAFDNFFEFLSCWKSYNGPVEIIIIDNCCHLRGKLSELFPGAIVKLDLFHGVQRLVNKISKKHPFSTEICREIGLCFRTKVDIGSMRTQCTPSADVILDNFKDFFERWSKVQHKGWLVLNKEFYKEYEKLRKHILLGCLSEIPPGLGTNKNERLHQKLNNLIGRNRISVYLADALFALILYRHNISKSEGLAYPIWSMYPNIPFDIISNTNFSNESELKVESSEVAFRVLGDALEVSQGEHSYTLSKASFKTKQCVLLSEVFCKINSLLPKDIKSRLYQYQGFVTLPSEVWKFEEYLTVCQKFQDCSITEFAQVAKVIGFDLKNESDFVTAFEKSLQNLAQTNIPNVLKNLILSKSKNCLELLQEELLGDRKDEYSTSQNDDFEKSVKNLMVDENAYHSIVKNLPCAAANLTGAVILIIPSKPGLPMLPIMPIEFCIQQPLLLIFNVASFKFVPLDFPDLQKETVGRPFCSCGSKDKIKNKRCLPSFRCKCARECLKCWEKCKCKGCMNDKPQNPEKRQQRQKMTPVLSSALVATSKNYMLSEEMSINVTCLNKEQHFLLEAICYFLRSNECISMNDQDENLFQKNITEMYYDIVDELRKNGAYDDIIEHFSAVNGSDICKWLEGRKKKYNIMKQLYSE